MKGKARARRHQNYIIKPFSGLHLSCGDLYERKRQTSRGKRYGGKVDVKQPVVEKKKKPRKKKKQKNSSKRNSLPVAEEYVPHKHSVRHFATQPVEGDATLNVKPVKRPPSPASNDDDAETHPSFQNNGHSTDSESLTDHASGAQTTQHTTEPNALAAGNGREHPVSLPGNIAELLQVYQRTCELAEKKMAAISPLLMAEPRSTQPSPPHVVLEHKMVLLSPPEHKDYSDAAEVQMQAHLRSHSHIHNIRDILIIYRHKYTCTETETETETH